MGGVLVSEADVVGAETPPVVVGVEVVGEGEDAPNQRVIDSVKAFLSAVFRYCSPSR